MGADQLPIAGASFSSNQGTSATILSDVLIIKGKRLDLMKLFSKKQDSIEPGFLSCTGRVVHDNI